MKALFLFFLFLPSSFLYSFLEENSEKANGLFLEFEPYFEQYSQKYNTNYKIAASIIYPELLRYSYYKNLLETKALEVVYIKKGKDYADFSIGYFQIKPSFVERLEYYIQQFKEDFILFDTVYFYKDSVSESVRAERVSRLKNKDWQLLYLNAFVKITEHAYDFSCYKTTEDSIRFLATVYNCGFYLSQNEIEKKMDKAYYPLGVNYPSDMQCAYSKVAVEFYQDFFK